MKLEETNFIGDWEGNGRGAQFGRVSVRFSSSGGILKAYGFGRTSSGDVEVFEFEGKAESNEKAVLNLVEYATDNPNTNPPSKAHIVVLSKDNGGALEVQFATDIGTQGVFWLKPASMLSKKLLSISPHTHIIYRRIKHNIRSKIKHLYLSVVVVITVMSIFGKTDSKISSVEALLLVIPLVFLFLDQIRGLVAALALRKVGPVEFESQEKSASNITPGHIVNRLHQEFGDKLPLFSTLNRVFVPRTKAILQLTIAAGQPVSMSEFNRMAQGIGVPDNDLSATLNVLKESGCIYIDNANNLSVSEDGRNYLLYEVRLRELSQN